MPCSNTFYNNGGSQKTVLCPCFNKPTQLCRINSYLYSSSSSSCSPSSTPKLTVPVILWKNWQKYISCSCICFPCLHTLLFCRRSKDCSVSVIWQSNTSFQNISSHPLLPFLPRDYSPRAYSDKTMNRMNHAFSLFACLAHTPYFICHRSEVCTMSSLRQFFTTFLCHVQSRSSIHSCSSASLIRTQISSLLLIQRLYSANASTVLRNFLNQNLTSVLARLPWMLLLHVQGKCVTHPCSPVCLLC